MVASAALHPLGFPGLELLASALRRVVRPVPENAMLDSDEGQDWLRWLLDLLGG